MQMSTTTTKEYKIIEDFSFVFEKIEKSFDFKFGKTELKDVKTFGELCHIITNKVCGENSIDCTSQQAFYKLRNSFSSVLNTDINDLTTDSLLLSLLPRRNRRKKVENIEKKLGFKTSLLRPPHWVMILLAIILVASFVELFFNAQFGIYGLILSVIGIWLARKVGKELDVKTLGQFAERITQENYIKSRRNQKTFNKKEIEKVLTDWFAERLGFDKSELTRETKFS